MDIKTLEPRPLSNLHFEYNYIKTLELRPLSHLYFEYNGYQNIRTQTFV